MLDVFRPNSHFAGCHDIINIMYVANGVIALYGEAKSFVYKQLSCFPQQVHGHIRISRVVTLSSI